MTTMTTHPTTPVRTSAAVARDLLDAIVAVDLAGLRQLFADDVWLRAMLVREIVEVHDADAAVAAFAGWFGTAHEVEVLEAAHRTVAPREHLVFRFRLRPPWAPDTWHVIEQSGYARIQDGEVRRLDLVCTGYVPEPLPQV